MTLKLIGRPKATKLFILISWDFLKFMSIIALDDKKQIKRHVFCKQTFHKVCDVFK